MNKQCPLHKVILINLQWAFCIRRIMARKHFDDYYNKVCSQLFGLQSVFDEMAKEVDDGMIEPERLEQVKLTIQPIKESYNTLCYIKYLLDMPARKSKHDRYQSQNRKVLSATKGYHREDIENRNNSIIKEVSL